MRAPILRQPLAPGAALALLALARPWLEARMAPHMLAELPLLFALGWWSARLAAHRAPGRAYAPALLLAALLLASIWMLPLALERAVTSPAVNLLKVLTLLLAGALTQLAWRPAGPILQGFFMLNWTWMSCSAGLLYQDAPQQLCSVYLSSQQWSAGVGLVTLGAAVSACWLLRAIAASGAETGPGSNK